MSGTWSAALIALTDGIVLFENPWATTPLDLTDVWQCFRLPMMRADFSWHRHSAHREKLALLVEGTLDRIELMFSALARGAETSGA